MSLGMFVVGGLVFSVYAGMALVITVFGKEKNEKEFLDSYDIHDVDYIDYDGMGNQGRIPKSKSKRRKRVNIKYSEK